MSRGKCLTLLQLTPVADGFEFVIEKSALWVNDTISTITGQSEKDKKLSCCREAARYCPSLNNISLTTQGHLRSFEIIPLSRSCVSPYYRF